MGFDIFMHSLRLVLNDRSMALKLSGVLYLIAAVPSLLLVLTGYSPQNPTAVSVLLLLASIILFAVCFLWVAVAWHRYVLLNEAPVGFIPPFNGNRILAYFGYSLLIGLVLLGVGLVAWLVVFLIVMVAPGIAAVGIILGIIVYVFLLVASYRLSPLLPGAAVGQSLTLGRAWEATKGASGAIIVLAIVSVIASLVIDIPAYLFGTLGTFGAFLALLWTLATGWIKLMVGISILTTIYGHYVEGRAIPR